MTKRVLVDGRTRQARRYREVRAALLAALGADRIGAAQGLLVDSISRLTTELEIAAVTEARGERVDPLWRIRAENSRTRMMCTLGLDKRADKQTRLAAMLGGEAA